LDLHFSWYFIVFFLLVKGWPVVLVVALASLAAGWRTHGIARVIFLSISAIFIAFLVGVGVWLRLDKIKEAREARENAASEAREYAASEAHRHTTLTAPRQIEGLDLPAGTAIYWKDDALTDLSTADLPGPTRILGVMLSGHIGHDYDSWWDVTLAEDAVIGGWPCSAGDIELARREPLLWRCDLSKETPVRAPRQAGQPAASPLLFPAGTKVSQSPGSDIGFELFLPKGKSMKLNEVGVVIPSGIDVHLFPNGAIRQLYAGGESLFSIRGIPFVTDIRWIYPEDLPEDSQGSTMAPIAVFGTLGQDVRCANHLYSSSAFARITLKSNTVEFIGYDGDKRIATPPIATSECAIVPRS
jgi:hypothetical protein